MSTIAERTFVINTQAVGTIELTATLETANASLASYITENRTYLDGVRAGIDSDLATLTAEANTERGSAYNKNFGILDNTVAEGSHVHDDRYYTKANVQSLLDGFQLLIETEETGFNLPLGNTANTVAAGNDPRFSDAREPTVHLHTKSAITDFDESDYATAAQGALADSALQQNTADARYYPQVTMDALLRGKEPAFDKNSGFNLPLGTEHNTVARGDHTHTHFNHEITTETTHALSAFNVVTTKNYVDEKVRQLLESEGFVFKHNEMLLLDGDDHLQYHTDARGDARYPLIQDLTTEITNRTAAITALNNQRTSDLSDIAENIQDVDDAAVHILGNQVIDGEKRFLGDVIVEGEAILQNVTIKSQSELDVGDAIVLLNAGETGTPSVNAGFEIERGTQANAQLLFDEANDQFVAGIVGSLKALATEDYVDGGLDEKLNLTGGTLTGTLNLKNNTLFWRSDSNTIEADTYSDANGFYIRQRNDGAFGATFAVKANEITTNKEFKGINPTTGAGFTTVNYLNDNFLSLNGGTLDGNIEFAPSNGNAIQILNAVGDGLSGFRFESDGDSYAFVYLKPENDELRIEKRTANAGFSSNELVLFDTYSQTGKELRGPDPSTATGYTPRQYVEDNFVDLTNNQDIAGVKNFKTNIFVDGDMIIGDNAGNVNPVLTINSTTGGNPQLHFQRNGGSVAKILGINNRLQLTGPGTGQLEIYNEAVISNVEVRGPDPLLDSGFTPKKYVEDNFLSLDGGTLDGSLVARDATPFITANSTTGNQAAFQMQIDSKRRGLLYHTASTMRFRKYATDATTVTSELIFSDGDNTTGGGNIEATSSITINKTASPSIVLKESGATNASFIYVNGRVDLRNITGNSTLSLNAGTAAFNVPVRVSIAPVNGFDLANKDYIDGGFLKLTGGTLSGNLTVSNPSAVVDAQATSGNPSFRLRDSANAIKAQVLYRANFDDVVLQQVSGDNNLIMSATKSEFNKDVNIGGDLTVQDADPVIKIDTTDTSKASRLEMRVNDALRGTIFTEASGTQRTFIEKRGGSVVQNQIVLDNDKTSFSTDVKIGGELNIDNAGSFSNRITVNATNTGLAQYRMNQDDKIIGLLYSQNSTVFLRQYNDPDNFGVGSQLQFTDGSVTATHGDLRSNNMGSATTSVTTKQYVDDNFLSLDGGTLTDDLIIDNVIGNPLLRMSRDGTTSLDIIAANTFSQIARYDSGGVATNSLNIYDTYTSTAYEVRGPDPSTATGFVTRQYAENNFIGRVDGLATLDDGTGENELAIKGGTNLGASISLHERRGFSGDNKFQVFANNSMSEDVVLVMPDAMPTAGQVLQVSSVSGGKAFMAWVTP